MSKNKQKIFFNLGFCNKNTHENSEKKFFCFAKECSETELFCKFCILDSHSNHKIMAFSKFLEQSENKCSEMLKDLPLSITSLKNRIEFCTKIEEKLKDIKDFLKKLDEKIFECQNQFSQEKQEIESKLEKLKLFKKEYFAFFRDKTPKINDENEAYQNILEKIKSLRQEMTFEDGKIKLKEVNYSISDENEDAFKISEKILQEIDLSLMKCQELLVKELIDGLTIRTTPQYLNCSQLYKFELKRNYIIKNLQNLNDSIIVASGHDNCLRYFKYTIGEAVSIKTIEGHNAWIRSLAFNQEYLATGSDDSSLKLWKLNGNSQLEHVHTVHTNESNKAYYWSLSFIKEGMIAAGRGQNDNFAIRVWDFEGFNKPKILYGHRNIVRKLCILEKENVFISISDDCTMKVWDIDTLDLKKTIYAHEKPINCLASNQKLGIVATWSQDFSLKIWVIRGLYKCVMNIFISDRILVLESFEKFNAIISGTANGLFQGRSWMNGCLLFTFSIGMEIHSILCDERQDLIFTGDSSGKISVWYLSYFT